MKKKQPAKGNAIVLSEICKLIPEHLVRQGRIFSPLSHEGREGLSFLTGVLRLASARGTARLAECGGCLLRFA